MRMVFCLLRLKYITPALLAIEYRPGSQEGVPPLWGWLWESQAYPSEMKQDPPYSYNGRKGFKQNSSEPKTLLLKAQTRWDEKDPTPRSHQRTGRNPPRWVTKPDPPIQSLNQTPPWVMGFGVGRERTIW